MEGPVSSMPWDEVVQRVGTEFGPTPWMTVTQAQINAFADATDDHFFIHVDPQRAAATPLKGTIAHGMLTLSLLPAMSYQVVPFVEGARFPLNYGFNRVRFVAPVPAGARLRGRFVLRQAEVLRADQRQLITDVTVEREGSTAPALVAEWVTRFVF